MPRIPIHFSDEQLSYIQKMADAADTDDANVVRTIVQLHMDGKFSQGEDNVPGLVKKLNDLVFGSSGGEKPNFKKMYVTPFSDDNTNPKAKGSSKLVGDFLQLATQMRKEAKASWREIARAITSEGLPITDLTVKRALHNLGIR